VLKDMPSVSVLGMGPIGSAVARSLLRAGYRVTVWNRTHARAVELETDGAVAASSAAQAVEASDVVIVTLSSMAVSSAVLGEERASAALRGRVLVQLTSASVEDSLTEAQWASEHGIEYLKGYTLSYPRGIGTDFGLIFCAGSSEVMTRHQDVLDAVGAVQYVGEDVSHPSIYATCAIWMYYSSLYGLLFASAYAEAQGIEMSRVTSSGDGALSRFLDEAVRDESVRIQRRDYSGDEASIDTHIAAYDHVLDLPFMADAGIDVGFAPHLKALMQRAVSAGDGGKDIAALFGYLR
jgi:3-hydroxyisobutyrate dehydrogenase-like beta-hydroxyacid dehydrogenase